MREILLTSSVLILGLLILRREPGTSMPIRYLRSLAAKARLDHTSHRPIPAAPASQTAPSSVLILALLILRRAFREKISRRVQYALWALVLVRLLTPVSLPPLDISVLTMAEPARETIAARLEAPEGRGSRCRAWVSSWASTWRRLSSLRMAAGVR